ncbi:carbohydrate ABC transporter permease [Ruminococcus flavefaciens]|uniref:carbohydrate ABC transporter permease n=1 Tax=Ruminococcus flavefaciens TaxID=1265 RepID=UPI0004918CF0|nr:carbohydrate ABC transporter permease [Ruminococcus flavefaciens]
MASVTRTNPKSIAFKASAYTFCALLTVLSLLPFIIMIVNATRSTPQIQSHALSLIPSKYLMKNYACFAGRDFKPFLGFKNSLIISCGATLCNIYFSTMTAFALVAYDWRLRKPFFTVIMAVLMIPAQVTSIGFYQFMHSAGWLNSYLPLILPSIAAPTTVFFMRQYMIPSLPMEILQSARIDGAGEFRIFNQIVLPMMKPAMATQAIFTFVGTWNQLFLPQVLLTDKEKYTMPMMVSLLNGDSYKTEMGAVYLGLLLTVIPLLVVYFALSKHIIAGVALGGVKG